MRIKLRPFNIGSVKVASPIVLAALSGYSDQPFRRICRRLGAPYCMTEMMLDRSLLVSAKLRRRFLTLGGGDHPVAGQIIGHDPPTMARAAALVESMGFDVVDLNFACPARKVQARGRGGAMMKDPALAREMILAVVGAVGVPVTLKLRSAFVEADSDHETFWRIADDAFSAGVAAICVHGRSVERKYFGKADWDFIAEVKRRYPDRTIIGSGDVRQPLDALRMYGETGVDAVAVARGAMGNPWFFRQVAGLAAGRPLYRPTPAEQRDVMERHYTAACELYGQNRGSKIMRKHGIKYARMHERAKQARMAFVQVKCSGDWQGVLDEFYPRR